MNSDFHNDPEFRELIRLYLLELSQKIPHIQDNIKSLNFPDLYRFAHNLKGTGGGYGFDEFTELGLKMMACANSNDSENYTALFEKFKKLLTEKSDEFNRG